MLPAHANYYHAHIQQLTYQGHVEDYFSVFFYIVKDKRREICLDCLP